LEIAAASAAQSLLGGLLAATMLLEAQASWVSLLASTVASASLRTHLGIFI
jgi:hypothetical protein